MNSKDFISSMAIDFSGGVTTAKFETEPVVIPPSARMEKIKEIQKQVDNSKFLTADEMVKKALGIK